MIYYIEDDHDVRELVVYTLNATGFEAEGFEKGSFLFDAIEKKLPQLILLDIMLPGEDGIEILNHLKRNSNTKKIPVIMVTAKSTEYDKVIGLDRGADDYISKPFGMMELVSRVKAVLRRSEKSDEKTKSEYLFENVKIDIISHLALVDNLTIDLTLKEFKLLKILMKNQGVVFTRDTLLENIWGYDFDGETRTVDVHIRTLRQKLGASGSIIETVRGVGYRIGGGSKR